MSKKCIYCKTEIDSNSVVDVCVRCGHGVWGEKMFNAIIENMEGARASGDLDQGSVTESLKKSPEQFSKRDNKSQYSSEKVPSSSNNSSSISIGGEVYSDF